MDHQRQIVCRKWARSYFYLFPAIILMGILVLWVTPVFALSELQTTPDPRPWKIFAPNLQKDAGGPGPTVSPTPPPSETPSPTPPPGNAHASLTTYEGSTTCLTCHATEVSEVHGSGHYQWSGFTPYVPGSTTGGKITALNDFCGNPGVNTWLGLMTNVDGVKVDGGVRDLPCGDWLETGPQSDFCAVGQYRLPGLSLRPI